MLLSMTGFGEAQQESEDLRVRAEIRAVNSRHLKLSCRIPEGYAALEPRIDTLVRGEIRRGTIQLSLSIDKATSSEEYRINRDVLVSYIEQLNHIKGELELASELSIDRLLGLPGIVHEETEATDDIDEVWPVIETTITAAMRQLAEMRRDEGRAMERDLKENCDRIGAELSSIQQRAPAVIEAYQTRLTERIQNLLESYDIKTEPADLLREVGIFADRVDISEETVRLESHLQQFDEIISSENASGRKLDFVIQEMFRETNTIGSKANDATIARHVVEIKTNIERLREMIQNVE